MFEEVLARLGIQSTNSGVFDRAWHNKPAGEEISSINPATGKTIARVRTAGRGDYDSIVEAATKSFSQWRARTAPERGELVRRFGQMLREHKQDLGLLVTLEAGKIRSEGEGEVQEMIDMCDFATGLSRQLYGLTIASERPEHRMFEQWHPLGPVGIITAFNFPVAVWAWNATLACVCGNPCIWKPSPTTPLTAIAVHRIASQLAEEFGVPGLFSLCITSDKSAGEWLAADERVPLVSATGSCEMGRSVARTVAARLGRSLLELGGNNGLIITESANLDLALRAVLFAAAGTAGQRCTTLRRLIVHQSIADDFVEQLVSAYRSIRIGDPWEEGVLMGPLINERAVDTMLNALAIVERQGGRVVTGGKRLNREGHFVEPTVVRVPGPVPITCEETFAPILYVMTYGTMEQAIDIHNAVPQGLASAIFTDSVRQAERFLSAVGSDCGIANVNIGPSGAEIGGAFGGEKQTGGGREAGSDAWKTYMRRQTCTINFGDKLPLAQGVKFEMP